MADTRYPIGDPSFVRIREEGFFYVDKTEYIHRMVNEGKFYFLSRPRRFGKSLLVSTLEAYFQGKKELFKGLAIDDFEKEWKKYPVFRFDLSAGDMSRHEELESHLGITLGRWEDVYGANPAEDTVSSRFRGLIQRAVQQTGLKAVVLVDEYDNPRLSATNAENQQIAKQTPSFTPKNVKSGVFVLFKIIQPLHNKRVAILKESDEKRLIFIYPFSLIFQDFTSS